VCLLRGGTVIALKLNPIRLSGFNLASLMVNDFDSRLMFIA